MRPTRPTAALLALAATTTLAACATTQAPSQPPTTTSSPTPPATSPSTPGSMPTQVASTTPGTSALPRATATTQGPCLSADHNLAPGGYCIYPAKVTWLPADVLPVDPATLDWTDPDAVATAYAITAGTWDSRHDKSGAYATRRAAIFTHQGRTTLDPTDPDTTRGQAEFTTTWQLDSYTTLDVNSVTTESPTGQPLQPDGSWQRIVDYTRTVHTRTDNATPITKTGLYFMTLTQDPTTGQWLIATVTTSEYDITN